MGILIYLKHRVCRAKQAPLVDGRSRMQALLDLAYLKKSIRERGADSKDLSKKAKSVGNEPQECSHGHMEARRENSNVLDMVTRKK